MAPMGSLRAFALALALVTVVAAQMSAPAAAATLDIDIVFSVAEKRIINEFFGVRPGTKVKPKKAKPGRGGGLPPGLARHLERHGTLPPGLAKRDLPPGLASRLPPTKFGHRRYIVGNDVVLIEAATGLILDVLEGVFGNN